MISRDGNLFSNFIFEIVLSSMKFLKMLKTKVTDVAAFKKNILNILDR